MVTDDLIEKYAQVVRERDDLKAEVESLRKGIPNALNRAALAELKSRDLKAALGKLVEAIMAYDLDLIDPRDYEKRVCNLTDAKAAAEKLLDPKTVEDK